MAAWSHDRGAADETAALTACKHNGPGLPTRAFTVITGVEVAGDQYARSRPGPGYAQHFVVEQRVRKGELPTIPLPGKYIRFRLDTIERFERAELQQQSNHNQKGCSMNVKREGPNLLGTWIDQAHRSPQVDRVEDRSLFLAWIRQDEGRRLGWEMFAELYGVSDDEAVLIAWGLLPRGLAPTRQAA